MRVHQKVFGFSVTLVMAYFLVIVNVFAQSGSSLKVSVLTKRGHPVRGVVLTLVSDDRVRVAVTNGRGEFEFGNLPALKYTLEASYLEFPIATIQDTQLATQGSKDLSITLDPPGGYFARGAGTKCMLLHIGFVPDAFGKIFYDERRGGESVEGTVDAEMTKGSGQVATISLFRAGQPDTLIVEVHPDVNGAYHFFDLDPGKYQLRVSREGFYTGTTMEFWVARGNTTRLGPIFMYRAGMQDLCGSVTEIIPFDDPVIPDPKPELIDPNRNP
jgi:hypothetical protein